MILYKISQKGGKPFFQEVVVLYISFFLQKLIEYNSIGFYHN